MKRSSNDRLERNTPGVYTLILEISEALPVRIGSLGLINFKSGYYLYTGSALGSGGLNARLARHLRKVKKVFWHIDYLTINQQVKVSAFIWANCQHKMECPVNKMMLTRFGVAPIPKFGSSDCSKCSSHFLRIDSLSLDVLIKKIMGVYLEVGLNPVCRVLSD